VVRAFERKGGVWADADLTQANSALPALRSAVADREPRHGKVLANPRWMKRSIERFSVAALAMMIAGAAQSRPPPPPSAPLAPGVAASQPPTSSSIIPALFLACTHDADCLAIRRPGCCHNGWKDAVAVTQKDAYEKAHACAEPRPICSMRMVRDNKVARCNARTRQCEMVKP
jgi:hypothetical protein